MHVRLGFVFVTFFSALTSVTFGGNVISQNSSFEDGTTNGWNNQQISSQILTRNWFPGFTSGGDEKEAYSELGQKLVRVSGDGAWGQIISLAPGKNRRHVFNAHACKKGIGSNPAGYATVTVTYYNAQWEQVDKVSIPLDTPDPSLNRGIGDGLNFYSLESALPMKHPLPLCLPTLRPEQKSCWIR